MKMIFLSLVLVATQAFAMGGKGDHQKRGEQFKKELNLTDEQVEKFKELKSKKGDLRALKKQFKESKKAFKTAMKDPKTSEADLKAKFESFMKLRDQFQRKRFAHMLEKRAILTPEQLAKFNELHGKWKKNKKGHRDF